MSDKELLELAAKAAGKDHVPHKSDGDEWRPMYSMWNPLTDDGDALRLAVKLRFNINYLPQDTDYPPKPHGVIITPFSVLSIYWPCAQKWVIERDKDELKATRRAIVRAAAEIGKGMK